ncbi:MAG: hypothetical protein JSU96_09665 [Acidobacteriota bacterium]|nr:MAG: hypothetical protein JSU96_09665 [Acidobacteriota bacterium]
MSAPPGSRVLVPISMSGGDHVSSLQFTLQFDSELLTIADEAPLRGDALTDHAVALGRQADRATFVVFSTSLTNLKGGDRDLISVLFEVSATAAVGSTVPLELIEEEGADEQGHFVKIIGAKGSIRIGSEDSWLTEGQNELIFPQVANGSFSGGDISILLVLVNRTQANSIGEVRFFQSDGDPFSVGLRDGRQGSSFQFTIAPGGSTILATDGSGDLSAGYARLSSTVPLGGVLLFTTRDSSGFARAEVGVGTSPVGNRFKVPVLVERSSSTNTGLALANTSAEDTLLTLDLKSSAGDLLEQQTIALNTGEQLPRYVTELFDLLSAAADFEGSVEIHSAEAISAVALRTQGSLLTTFPVIVLPEDRW